MMNKNSLKLECTSNKLEVPWKLKDILIVFLISFIAILLSLSDYVTLFISLFLKDTSSQRLLILLLAERASQAPPCLPRPNGAGGELPSEYKNRPQEIAP
jgi:hypothetical protein